VPVEGDINQACVGEFQVQIGYRRALHGTLLASASILGIGLGQAFGAVTDYPDGSTNSTPIVLTDNASQLRVLTGSAIQSGVISESSGSFGFEKIGSGALILTGTNTYTGVTTISAGTLQIGNGGTVGSIAGDIVDNANLAFKFSGNNGPVYTGQISGSGSLTVASGYVSLAGNNTYTGGTIIDPGATLEIAGTVGAIAGDVVDNGNFAPIRNFAGDISGSGTVTIRQGFPITLSGNNTYTGATILNPGSYLIVNGSSANVAMNVVPAATLGGTGTVGTTIIAASSGAMGSGLISPGNAQGAVGTLTVAGNLHLFGQFTADVNATAADEVVVNGNATIGGVLFVPAASGVTYAPRTYTLLTASGGLSGWFETINLSSNFGSGITPFVSHDANSIFLKLSQDTNWRAAPASNVFGDGINWSSGTAPGSGETGVMGASSGTAININALTTIGGLRFALDSPQYSFTVTGGGLTFNNTGIVIDHFAAPTFNIVGSSLTLAGDATTGTAAINVDQNSVLYFTERSSLGFGLVSGSGILDVGGVSSSRFFVHRLGNIGVINLGGKTLVISDAAVTVSGSIVDNSLMAGSNPSAVLVTNGTAIITGASTYSGGTTIDSNGTVRIGAGGTTGSIMGNVTNNGLLSFERSDSITFGGVISGTGKVVQISTGLLTSGNSLLTLTGNNSYSGGTTVSNGLIRFAALENFGTGRIVLNGGGLQWGSGNTVDVSSRLNPLGVFGGIFDTNGNAVTLAGAITGTGGLTKMGAGTLTLTGENSYTGDTTISAGTVQIGNGSISGTIPGNIVDNGALVFSRSDAASYAGVISGTGSVAQAGNGTIILTGASTYTGGTTVLAGTLQLGNGGTSGSIGGDISNNGALVFSRSNAVSFVGIVSGAGSLTQAGSGMLTLTGANTYTGGTIVSAGTLQLGDGGTIGSVAGNVTDNSFLAFNRSDSFSFVNVISGNGAVSKGGVGTLTLPNTSTYTGATSVTAGTLNVSGSIAASSGVTAASGATLAGTGTVSSTTIQSGGMLSAGGASVGTLNVTGNLTLNSGAITLVDVTTTSADRLLVSGTAAINGTLNVTFASGSYVPAQYTLLTSTGALSGTFSGLNFTGAPSGIATEILYDANNAFLKLVTGFSPNANFNIDVGTINVSGDQTTGGLSGTGGTINIATGSLTDNQTSDSSYAGAFTGSGTLTKTGAGALILNGNSGGFTGTTSVTGGLLEVGDATHPGATLGGTVNIGAGGTLGGHGTVTGSVTNAGSTAPGGSIGTLTVAGNYSFTSGASLQQEVAANGSADLLKVDGVVSIAGNTALQVQATDPVSSYARVTSYTIVTGAGGVSGSFATVTSPASLTSIVTYAPGAVNLTLVRNDISLASLATTANQAAVGAALSATPGSALYAAVAPMSDAQLPAAFNSLSGEIHASLTDALLYDGGWLADAVQSRGDAGEGVHLWGSEEYRRSDFAGTANTAAASGDLLGTALGADVAATDGVRLGAVMGFSHGTVRVDARASDARLNSLALGGYASIRMGAFGIDATVAHAWNNIGTFREANAGGTLQAQSADYDATTINAFVEARYRFDLGGYSASPFISLNSARVQKDAFAETGGIAALSGGGTDQNVLFTSFGGRFDTSYDFADGELTPWISLGWEHASDTVSAAQGLAFSTGPAFSVKGAPIGRDAFKVQAGAGLALGGIHLNLLYAGRTGGTSSENSVRLNLQTSF
jgi:outer membrane autotransporter protein